MADEPVIYFESAEPFVTGSELRGVTLSMNIPDDHHAERRIVAHLRMPREGMRSLATALRGGSPQANSKRS